MKKYLHRFRVWNEWRKKNCNDLLHKLLVLLGLRLSPTFELLLAFKVIESAFRDFGDFRGDGDA